MILFNIIYRCYWYEYIGCDKFINYKLMFKNIKLRKCYYINVLLNIYRKQIYIY